MFSGSESIITSSNPLSKIWLAAHYDKKIPKSQLLKTDINQITNTIISNSQPITLKVSAQLLLGLAKIFSRKTKYLLEDCNSALLKIKIAFKSTSLSNTTNVDMIGSTTNNNTSSNLLLTDTLSDLDVILGDAHFDLSALINQKINSKIDNTFLSFSQSTQSPLINRDSSSIGEIEVGRDAQSIQFSPIRTPTKDPSSSSSSFNSLIASLIKGSSSSNRISKNQSLLDPVGTIAANENQIDYDFGRDSSNNQPTNFLFDGDGDDGLNFNLNNDNFLDIDFNAASNINDQNINGENGENIENIENGENGENINGFSKDIAMSDRVAFSDIDINLDTSALNLHVNSTPSKTNESLVARKTRLVVGDRLIEMTEAQYKARLSDETNLSSPLKFGNLHRYRGGVKSLMEFRACDLPNFNPALFLIPARPFIPLGSNSNNTIYPDADVFGAGALKSNANGDLVQNKDELLANGQNFIQNKDGLLANGQNFIQNKDGLQDLFLNNNDDYGLPIDDFIGDISAINPPSFNFDADDIPNSSTINTRILDDSITERIDTSIIFPDDIDHLNRAGIEFDGDEITPTDLAVGSSNSKRVLDLLKDNCGTNRLAVGECSFFELSAHTTRSSVAKLFFEVLVLKGRGVVDVRQEEYHGDIIVCV